MSALSKEEYLKRYLSADDVKEKKRRKKIKSVKKKSQVKIIDDDVSLKSLLPDNLSNRLDDDITVEEDAPAIAEYIDERPEEVQQLEKYRTTQKWKTLSNSGHLSAPGRKKQHESDSDDSPPRRKMRHDSDSDMSPPRKMRHDSESDQSPPKKIRHDSDSDQSPPRKQKHFNQSAPHKVRRHDSDSDQSPPRKRKQQSDSDQSPPRRHSNHPVQHRSRHDSDSDQALPRKRRRSKQPHQNKGRHEFDSDQSPPRKKIQNSDSDQSPPRRKSSGNSVVKNNIKEVNRQNGAKRQSRWNKPSPDRDSDKTNSRKATKTLSGAKAGLSSAQDFKDEAEKLRKREKKKFQEIDDSLLGKNATTVFRNKKDGRKRDIEEEEAEKQQTATKQKEKEDRYAKWGRGLKQSNDHAAYLEDAVHEMSKPLARHKDDDDLDEMLKKQDLAEDPMLAYIKKKAAKKQGKKKVLPVYTGPEPPPNRYGIRPGYRWDGVDRSNGFERKLFAAQSEKKSMREEAYKWSTEDM